MDGPDITLRVPSCKSGDGNMRARSVGPEQRQVQNVPIKNRTRSRARASKSTMCGYRAYTAAWAQAQREPVPSTRAHHDGRSSVFPNLFAGFYGVCLQKGSAISKLTGITLEGYIWAIWASGYIHQLRRDQAQTTQLGATKGQTQARSPVATPGPANQPP